MGGTMRTETEKTKAKGAPGSESTYQPLDLAGHHPSEGDPPGPDQTHTGHHLVKAGLGIRVPQQRLGCEDNELEGKKPAASSSYPSMGSHIQPLHRHGAERLGRLTGLRKGSRICRRSTWK